MPPWKSVPCSLIAPGLGSPLLEVIYWPKRDAPGACYALQYISYSRLPIPVNIRHRNA